jgi:hypothetical protein
MVDPEKLLQEMTPKEYENLTGQKKPADRSTLSPSKEPTLVQSSEPKVDDELGQYGGDSAELHD